VGTGISNLCERTNTMATKLVIKSAPKTFPLKVEVPTPTGTGEINFEAKHFPSTVWAKMREAHAEEIGKVVQGLFDAARKTAEQAYADSKPKKGATEEQKEAGIAELIKSVPESEIAALKAEHSAKLIAQIVIGWDLEEPLGADSLVEMCDTYPGAAEAVFAAYNQTREGLRAKN